MCLVGSNSYNRINADVIKVLRLKVFAYLKTIGLSCLNEVFKHLFGLDSCIHRKAHG